MDELEGVLLVRLEDRRAAGLIGLGPLLGPADQSDGKLRADRVVGVDLVVGHRQVAEVHFPLAVAFHEAADQLETGRVIVVGAGMATLLAAFLVMGMR